MCEEAYDTIWADMQKPNATWVIIQTLMIDSNTFSCLITWYGITVHICLLFGQDAFQVHRGG